MFVIEGRECSAEISSQRDIDRIAAELKQRAYRPVLGSIIDAVLNAAAVDVELPTDQILYGRYPYPHRRERFGIGEIFFRHHHAFVVMPARKKLLVWGFRYHTRQPMMEQFCRDFEEATKARLDKRAMDFTWKDISTRSRFERYQEEGEEVTSGTQPTYTPEDAQRANSLSNKDTRLFVLQLAQVRKLRATDASANINIDTQRLIDDGLIKQEYLVSCREDSHTISTLPTKDLLEHVGEDFRCPVCNRPFGKELVQEIYVLTDAARSLLSGNRWMSIWITELLLENGVEREDLRWGLEIDGEELDLMLNMGGLRVFFELKDREFGLGDAYPFVYRVSRYRGHWGVVVTTDKVAKNAKKFLEEQSKPTAIPPTSRIVDFKIIEGADRIPQGIQDLVNELTKSAVLRIVAPFGELIEHVVKAWLDAQIAQAI